MAVAVDPVSGKVFVSDTANNRVLRYRTITYLTSGVSAEAVIGQRNFNSNLPNQGGGPARDRLSGPTGIHVDRNGRLWIADTGNNRVLMFDDAARVSTAADADRIFGQSSPNASVPGTSSTRMRAPTGVWVDRTNRLWVADSGNNRVIRFDRAPNDDTVPPVADRVLGQWLFTTFGAALGPASLTNPTDVSVDADDNLWVADSGNNRVVKFRNSSRAGNGANASAVLGQGLFNSNGSSATRTGMNGPTSVFATGGRLWVSDSGNNRVIGFNNAAFTPSGNAADFLIGQADFTDSAAATAANRLRNPAHLWIDASGSAWVADSGNNRTLRFTPDRAIPIVTLRSKSRIRTTKRRVRIAGNAFDADGIAQVEARAIGQPRETISRGTSWRFRPELRRGKNRFLIVAKDTRGLRSKPLRVIVNRRPR